MTPKGQLVAMGPPGWTAPKNRKIGFQKKLISGKLRWSVGSVLPPICPKSRDNDSSRDNQKKMCTVMTMQQKTSGPLPPIPRLGSGEQDAASVSQKHICSVMSIQQKFSALFKELNDWSLDAQINCTKVEDKRLDDEAIHNAIRKLHWTRPGLVSLLIGSGKSLSGSPQRVKVPDLTNELLFEPQPELSPSQRSPLHESPVGFGHVENRSRQDSVGKRGMLKTHKATVPKKGQIKVTAMDYELENPGYYDKPTVEHQNIQKKPWKRRPRTGKSYLINRPDIVDQIRQGDKLLTEERIKTSLKEDREDLSSYTVRDLTSLLSFTDHVAGKKSSNRTDDIDRVMESASSPVIHKGVKLSTVANQAPGQRDVVSGKSNTQTPIGLTRPSSSYIDNGRGGDIHKPIVLSTQARETSFRVHLVPSQTPLVPAQTPCVPMSSPGFPTQTPLHQGHSPGAYFVNPAAYSLPPAVYPSASFIGHRHQRVGQAPTCPKEDVTFTPFVQGRTGPALTKMAPAYSSNAQKYILSQRDYRAHPPMAATIAPSASTTLKAHIRVHGGNRKR